MLKVPAGGEQANWRVAQALGRAAGRSVIAVTRDAHRDPGAQAVITRLLAVRPDTIVVEIKAAAIDVVAEHADRIGKRLVLAGNDVVPLPGEPDLDRLVEQLAAEATERETVSV